MLTCYTYSFCNACLLSVINNHCPLCKTQFDPTLTYPAVDVELTLKQARTKCGVCKRWVCLMTNVTLTVEYSYIIGVVSPSARTAMSVSD